MQIYYQIQLIITNITAYLMNFIIITLLIIPNYASTSSSNPKYKYQTYQSYKQYHPNPLLNDNQIIDEAFLSEIINENIQIKWRRAPFLNDTIELPDILFSLKDQQEILVIGFNQDGHQYYATRIRVRSFQPLKIYNRTDHIQLKKQFSVLKVLQIADQVADKPQCQETTISSDNVQQLISLLNN
ncbi:unnamed protein product (macronuclear) [Paramecium tetraurelia]|uniref:Uncharacterized protein n=1 Tax=Paramecium tetraurelia TaxID=5888 RepID=A0D8B0_PARTE|nr:uncharacterized protein GSPATT00014244001 [Paramecium tetraurelia]CAK79277.1 unnamed protein product [Paramecium tetraurelia]|eukprot:XP_001446674.1 hypothetical protein (macronuclear) [Paramecium tetraurelia strain d4-2]